MTRTPLPRRVLLVWALFLVRGAFYCVAMPLWEGWDEYAHFAWLDHWITAGTLPRLDSPMAREVEESLRLAPLSDELRWMGPPHLVREDWWALPSSARADRMRRLTELRAGFEPSGNNAVFYEAQQPPLYYMAISVPLRFASSLRLPDRVLLARFISLFIASLAVPFAWMAAGPQAGLMAAGLLAVAPGFALDTFRIANDSLAIALFAIALWMLMRPGRWWALGIVLGLGLLAKAYLLVLLPVACIRRRFGAVVLAVAIAGWWYARNLLMGSSLTGWLEHAPLPELWHQVFAVNWVKAAAVMAKSFTWFGGWSFVTLRSWIYVAVEVTGTAAVAGALHRKRGALAVPCIACACFGAAMLYGSLVYAAGHNGAILPGWYFWPAGTALAVLAANAPRWLSLPLAGMLAAIDIYGASAVLLPYYAGLTPRGHANVTIFGASLARLNVPAVWAFAWIAATVGICIVLWGNRRDKRMTCM